MPNILEEPERGNMAFLLCSAFQLAIAKGWRPVDKKKEAAEKKKRLSNIADVVLERKLKFNYSDYYRRDLIRTHANWNKYLRKEGLSNMHENRKHKLDYGCSFLIETFSLKRDQMIL